jgi:hypothetical protein
MVHNQLKETIFTNRHFIENRLMDPSQILRLIVFVHCIRMFRSIVEFNNSKAK